jgi:hypothetical protein
LRACAFLFVVLGRGRWKFWCRWWVSHALVDKYVALCFCFLFPFSGFIWPDDNESDRRSSYDLLCLPWH